MLRRTCLSMALVGCFVAPAFGQEYYAADRTASNDNFATVNFMRAGDEDSGAADAADKVDLKGKSDEAETIEMLREQLKRMELRLEELENDVEKKVAKASESSEEAEEAAEAAEDVDKRLKELEKGFEEQGESIEKIDSTIPGLVHSGHKKPKATFFGRIHLDYWAFPEADDGIDTLEREDPQDNVTFRRMRIGIKGDLNDNVFYKYEGEFAGGVSTSYRDAFIGFRDLPLLNTVIIGNHKRPQGLDHLNSSRYNVFVERPFIIEALSEDSRRLGFSSNGLSEDQAWNWRYGVFHQNVTQTTDGFEDDHYQLEFAGRLANTAWYDESSGGRGYFHWAFSGGWGSVDGGLDADNAADFRTRPEARSDQRWLDTGDILGAEEVFRYGVETVLNIGAFQMTAEYLQGNVERDPTVAEDVQFGGGYLQVAYFLTGEHTPWVRKTGTLGRVKPYENFFSVRDHEGNRAFGLGAWQIAARYSYADLDDGDIDGGVGESFTLGLNWWWNPNARMQFNYLVGQIDRDIIPDDQGNYQILGARWMVDF